jgi:hypothetical protein
MLIPGTVFWIIGTIWDLAAAASCPVGAGPPGVL